VHTNKFERNIRDLSLVKLIVILKVRKSDLKEKVSKKRKSEYFILPLEIYHPMVLENNWPIVFHTTYNMFVCVCVYFSLKKYFIKLRGTFVEP
jgi:hypothetical protein